MAKRGKGEGTIYQNGNRWIGQYYTPDGKRKTVSGAKRKEVQEKLNRALVELAEGRYIDMPKVQFGVFMRDYMETYKKQEISATTYSNYVEFMEFYLYKNPLSDTELGKVTTDQLQRYYNSMTQSGLSGRTVRQVHSIINGAFKNAVKRKLIHENPNGEVTLPKKAGVEITPPSIDEVRQLLDLHLSTKIGHKFYNLNSANNYNEINDFRLNLP